jgi:hypothetical protein
MLRFKQTGVFGGQEMGKATREASVPRLAVSAVMAVLVLVVATPRGAVAGDSATVDLWLAYHARDEVNYGTRDDDILRLGVAFVLPGARAGDLHRYALFGGLRDIGTNLGKSSGHAAMDEGEIGVEALWLRGARAARGGIGVRVIHASVAETGLEVGYVHERRAGRADLRFLGGVQAVSGDVAGREDAGVFGLAEVGYWTSERLVLRASLTADSDGAIGGIGAELAVGRRGASLYLDWGQSIGSYRGVGAYDSLSAGLRLPLGRVARGGGQGLRDHQYARARRSLFRPVGLQ